MKVFFATISAIVFFSSCKPSDTLPNDIDITALVKNNYGTKLFLIKYHEANIAQKEIVLDLEEMHGLIRQAGFLSDTLIFVLYYAKHTIFLKTYDIASKELMTIYTYETDFGQIFLMDMDSQNMYYQFAPTRSNILLSFNFIGKEEKEVKTFPHGEEIVDIKTNAVQNTVTVNTNKNRFYRAFPKTP